MSNLGFDRRTFLKFVLLSLGAFLGTYGSQGQAQGAVNARVIVVGAGMAGLAAAHTLNRRGAAVTVLEAKPQMGGRVQTDYSLGAPVELGAGWIHGPQGNPISALAAQVMAATFVTDDDSLMVYDPAGYAVRDDALDDLDRRFERLLNQVDDYVNANDLMSLRAAIARVNPSALNDPLINWALTAFTEFDAGGPIEHLSAAYFDEDKEFAGKDVILPQGYDRILLPLAAGLDIRLNTIVTAIRYGAQGVTVATNGGDLTADYVICTVPLGVLKAGNIEFHPALPSQHQQSIRKIPMGHVTKVALQFSEAFWPLNVQYFGFQSAVKGKWPYFMNYRTFSDQNMLLALSFGTYSSRVEAQPDAAIQAEIMDILSTMFGDEILQPEQLIVTRWSQDPHTLGAYSFIGSDVRPRDFNRLAQPVANRLFFAGEHTIFNYHGTVHGAYLSGISAAEKIIARTR